MAGLTRRTVLRGAAAAAAGGALGRPHVANAAATTASAWWAQGFIPDEDVALRAVVDGYQKQSGNKIDLSITPFAPLRQKIISAITSGVVPEVIDANGIEVVPEQAWEGRLVDVSDVVDTQKSRCLPSALLGGRCWDNVEKRRSFFGVPYKASVRPFHVWKSLLERAGYKVADIPGRWDPFIDFFKPVQQKLRDHGMRHVYAAGFVLSTVGDDVNSTFDQFLIAYGGGNIVTPDGRPHTDDPKVRAAIVKTLAKLGGLFKDGFEPPGTLNWNDADDNNAFHARQVVLDLDGTLSTEVAMLRTQRDAYYHEVMIHAMPPDDDGKPVPHIFPVNLAFIPKGAKNVEVGKEFIKYLIEPKVNGAYLKGGIGRFLPIYPELVNDPFWRDPKQDPHRPPYVAAAFDGPTVPLFYVFNPAYAQVWTEHVWGVALADVMTRNVAPEEAADKALQRVAAIFAKYPIHEA